VLISALCVYYPADVSGKSHMKSSQRCVVRSSMKVDPQAKRRRRIPSCDPSVDGMLLEMPDQDRHIPSQNTFTPGGLPDVRNRKSEPGSSYQLYPAKTHDDRQASEEAAPIVPFRQQIPSGDTECQRPPYAWEGSYGDGVVTAQACFPHVVIPSLCHLAWSFMQHSSIAPNYLQA
jgi:hypothetical protein